MAIKKTTTKKTAPKKKPAVKAVKNKKPTAKTGVRKHVGLAREEESFMTFRINRQTVYWMVLGAVVILFTMWILKLQMDIQALYDQIEVNTAQSM